MSAFTPDQLKQLQAFIEVCRLKPDILHMDEFKFFKDYIESLGGKVPAASSGPKRVPNPEPKTTVPPPEPESKPAEESEEESDVEIDNEGVIGNYRSHLLICPCPSSHHTCLNMH